MIVEFGQFCLILSLVIAIVQSIVPLVGAHRGHAGWMGVGQPAAVSQFVAITIAFFALMNAYVVSDFSVLNVVQNSHSGKPLIYKISGTWGNHEGSMLLWVLILALFGALVAVFGRGLPDALRARVLAVQAMIGVGFLAFIIFTSNPFERIAAPLDGQGLNPLLQDPGLALHPPLLYLGYVGFSVVFSFAAAALIGGNVDAAWGRWVRPWTLLAWCGLTAGIALGSYWAYYELGWGGWWFWDPVENASFMPWLTGTALLHSAIVVEKRDSLKSWTILLAITTFALSLLGTFLVRSGVLTSVHAFAVDPARGVFILALMGMAVGGSLSLFALRAPRLGGGGLFAPISREGALVLNNLFLASAAGTVLIGTLYPLLLEAIGGDRVSVGPPFFNLTVVPLMAPLVAAVGVGPLLSWKRGDLTGALARLKVAGAICLVGGVAIGYLLYGGPVLAVFAIMLAFWTMAAALSEVADRIKLLRVPLSQSWSRLRGLPRSAIGMSVAHFGLGITVLGITGASAWSEEVVTRLRPGETFAVAGYHFSFDKLETINGPNYQAQRGYFSVEPTVGNQPIELVSEKRWYPVARTVTTEVGLHITPLGNLYVNLGSTGAIGETQEFGGEADSAWSVTAYHHPLIGWIWWGSGLLTLGGLISLSDRRLRIGLAARRPGKSSPGGRVLGQPAT